MQRKRKIQAVATRARAQAQVRVQTLVLARAQVTILLTIRETNLEEEKEIRSVITNAVTRDQDIVVNLFLD
jgi:hypothetical protein